MAEGWRSWGAVGGGGGGVSSWGICMRVSRVADQNDESLRPATIRWKDEPVDSPLNKAAMPYID